MNRIIFPLKSKMKGEAVGDLQDGLQTLEDKGFIKLRGDRKKIAEARALERSTETYGSITVRLVKAFQGWRGMEMTGEVDEVTAKALNEVLEKYGVIPPQKLEDDKKQQDDSKDQEPVDEAILVYGIVRQADGDPLAGVIVRAFEIGVKTEELMGKDKTDQTGTYKINFVARKKAPDLIIRVFDSSGKQIAVSPIIYDASLEEVMDFFLGEGKFQGVSEYERNQNLLAPFLKDVRLEDVDGEQELSYLATKTGISQQHILFMAEAARLGAKTELPPEALYSLFRQQLSTNLSALLVQDHAILRRTLESAVRDNIIPLKMGGSTDAILQRLQGLRVEQTFTKPEIPGKFSLGELLGTSTNLNHTQQAKFVQSAVTYQGRAEDFWNSLRKDATFKDEKIIADLQFTLQLGTLTQNHVPLVTQLRKQFPSAQPESLRELAKMDIADWEKLLKTQVAGKPVGTPPDVPGETEAEKITNYARTLTRRIETAFPTPVFVHKLEQTEIGNKTDLLRFFSNNLLNFDLPTTAIALFVRQNETALHGITDQQGIIRMIEGLQRVFLISPLNERSETALTLWREGFDSAQSIARKGRGAFVRQYAAKVGGEDKAREIHRRARHQNARALTLLGKYGAAFHSLPVIGEWVREVADVPNWNELFGPLALCECEHCRSVYSPAAYLVDLLEFLKDMDATTFPTAREVLFDRRPDIGEIELSCENTNTLLPYVDLLNEILENAVSPLIFEDLGLATDLNSGNNSEALRRRFLHAGFSLSENATILVETTDQCWRIADRAVKYIVTKAEARLEVAIFPQTTASSQELEANPEYINQVAYDKLAEAEYPWDLPFNLWVEEARTYLEHLGAPRHRLMKTFYPAPAELTDPAIAHEYLNLTTKEAEIITGIITSGRTPDPWEYWGYSAAGTWSSDLSQVSIFLQKSALTYKEVLELLNTKFINRDKNIRIAASEDVDPATCDVTELKITFPSDPLESEKLLNKIHRFIRLQQKLGWTMRDLDRAITAFKAADIGDLFPMKLSHIQRLRAEFKTPLDQMLSWWGLLDTAIYQVENEKGMRPLYEKLFLNKAVLSPEDTIFLLNEDRSELRSVGSLNDTNTPALSAALGISADDLLLLRDSELTGNVLNLENLSSLYHAVSFSKALKLSILNYLSVKALIGINPFSPANTEDTLRFVEKVRKIRDSRFSIAELDYLLRHKFEQSSGIAPAEEGMGIVLREIRDGLRKIIEETTLVPDPTGEVTKSKLAILLPADKVDTAVELIAGRSAMSPVEQNNFIDEHFAQFLSDVTEAKEKLVGPSPTLVIVEERFAYVLGPLMVYLQRTLSKNLVTQKLSAALSMDVSATELLLTSLSLPDSAGTLAWLMEKFLVLPSILPRRDDELVPMSRTEAGGVFSKAFDAFVLLKKIATILSRLKITFEETKWILERGAGLEWLHLNDLPLSVPPSPPLPAEIQTEIQAAWKATFEGWERLVDLFRLRDSLALGEPALFDLLDIAIQVDLGATDTEKNTAKTNFMEKLSQRTSWSMEDLESLVGPKDNYKPTGLLRPTFPDDFRDERPLLRLQACFQIMNRLGASASQLGEWCKADLNPDDARAIKQTAKAKYDEERWRQVAKPLRDALREKQRSALVTYLMAQNGLRDSNGLYQYLLIDPEMDPCMITSRIKQAISSVQLFIQRCLMGLERQVNPSDDEAREWQWRKNYRVWEANRKVFLYPENWIEPELRNDKSPFFQDLENELLQNEITAETAEQAYLRYLRNLDPVARLEIAGMYHQLENQNGEGAQVDILHVFGRTRNTPHIYYYRQRVNNSYWTPWQKVDVDIEGDHLIPVVWNRRLYLFWPIFTEKQEEKTVPVSASGDDLKPAPKYLEIKLAWSEKRNGNWSSKKVSPELFSTRQLKWVFFGQELPVKKDYFFKAWITNSPVVLDQNLPVHKINAGTLVIDGFGHAFSWRIEPRLQLYPSYFRHLLSFWLTGSDEAVNINPDDLLTPWFEAAFPHDPLAGGTPSYYLPLESSVDFMKFAKNTNGQSLTLYAGDFDSSQSLLSFESPYPVKTLNSTPSKYQIAYPHQFTQFLSQAPFFYEDDTRSYFVRPYLFGYKDTWKSGLPSDDLGIKLVSTRGSLIGAELGFISVAPSLLYQFENFYHPFIGDFIKQLNRYGLEGLLSPGNDPEVASLRWQLKRNLVFGEYDPTEYVQRPLPMDEVDFSPDGSYSSYNWELFFHIPLLIADRLSKNQRFEDAQKWFHYIFDPREVIYHGLWATYFDDKNLDAPILSRIDREINFDGGVGSPDPVISPDTFSVRWTGKVRPRYDEAYTFYASTDDGVRLWVDNQLLIDNWVDQRQTEISGSISLKAGHYYDIRMEYYENGGGAIAKLLWESPSTPKEIIPSSQLILMPYWKIRPFFNDPAGSQRIEELMKLLESGTNSERSDLENLITQWENDPFNPHLVARGRLMAYQKAVVMKYIDNLIAWGDAVFQRDTIEAINEATQLYILAAEILGPRPELIPLRAAVPVQTYTDLVASAPHNKLDAFSNAAIENLLLIESESDSGGHDPSGSVLLRSLYFCIPKNDKLLSYWDTVADRLFKIRHCMNIEGVVRQLPLFEPPIDPGLLTRAAAAGVDLTSAMNNLNAPLPYYRFAYMLQKAMEFCNEVRGFGSALLGALEKRNAEELSLLRSQQEVSLLSQMSTLKQKQIDEAGETLESLQHARAAAEIRLTFYTTRLFTNSYEEQQLSQMDSAAGLQSAAGVSNLLAAYLNLIPDFKLGAPTTTGATFGGTFLSGAARVYAQLFEWGATQASYQANRASIMGNFTRRQDDWDFQKDLARKEMDQIDKQILAAQLRLEIAQADLDNHERQIENAKEVDTLMRDKFTNKDLYDWMMGQASSLYFQMYCMAYDLAKRSERTFQYELGNPNAVFIKYGYWDNLKKGLLSGERLASDLKRMEMAYLDQNKREYELTKNISLVSLDPMALLQLKESGRCSVKLPEVIFDLDYPGHYFRRIKSVSLTIPCITGPYTSVNCTLTLQKNSLRVKNDRTSDLQVNYGTIQSIATSSGQNDNGLFELNFRDERYLPFEGAGAIDSEWQLELAGKWKDTDGNLVELPQFDFDTISDVIFQIRYTARDGGNILKQAVVDELEETINGITMAESRTGLFRLFSARHEFPGEWHRCLHPAATATEQKLELPLTQDRFPFVFHKKEININKIELFLKPKDSAIAGIQLSLTHPAGTIVDIVFDSSDTLDGLLHYEKTLTSSPGSWSLKAAGIPLNSDAIENLVIVCHYTVSSGA